MHFPLLQLEAKPSDAATAQKAARRCSGEISRDVNIFIDILPGTMWKASCPLFGGFERVLSKQDNGHFGFQEHKLYRNHSKLKVTRTKLSHCHDHFRFATEAVEAFRGLPTISRGGAWVGKFYTGSLVAILLSHQAVALAEEKNVVPKSGSRHVC